MSALSEIENVIEEYLDGLHRADTERLKSVLHPKAVYGTADEATPLIRGMDEYFAEVAKRVSPASQGEKRNGVIDRIDIAGENTANARVRCTMNGRDFVDFLSFIRTEGEWRILSKVFQVAEAEAGT
ncbi:MAG: nuclear transport factor 2 family protein [Pseudomonadota bacterium]